MQRVFSGGIDEATFQNWVAKEAESIKEFERRVKCLIEIVASEDKYFDHEPVEALQIIDNNVSGKNRDNVCDSDDCSSDSKSGSYDVLCGRIPTALESPLSAVHLTPDERLQRPALPKLALRKMQIGSQERLSSRGVDSSQIFRLPPNSRSLKSGHSRHCYQSLAPQSSVRGKPGRLRMDAKETREAAREAQGVRDERLEKPQSPKWTDILLRSHASTALRPSLAQARPSGGTFDPEPRSCTLQPEAPGRALSYRGFELLMLDDASEQVSEAVGASSSSARGARRTRHNVLDSCVTARQNNMRLRAYKSGSQTDRPAPRMWKRGQPQRNMMPLRVRAGSEHWHQHRHRHHHQQQQQQKRHGLVRFLHSPGGELVQSKCNELVLQISGRNTNGTLFWGAPPTVTSFAAGDDGEDGEETHKKGDDGEETHKKPPSHQGSGGEGTHVLGMMPYDTTLPQRTAQVKSAFPVRLALPSEGAVHAVRVLGPVQSLPVRPPGPPGSASWTRQSAVIGSWKRPLQGFV